MKYDLTQGSVAKNLIRFSVPYLLSCFLQTFYGLTDLFVTGRFNGAEVISAVSIGSQVLHMLTVIIAGLAMGSTVLISNAVGAKKQKKAEIAIGNTISLFLVLSVLATVFLLLSADPILRLMSTPEESVGETRKYLEICFAGLPFIAAYNVASSIFRGMGDSKSPTYFVAVAGVINIVLDFLLIGNFGMGAAGAALATVLAQLCSVLFALVAILSGRGATFGERGLRLSRQDFRFQREALSKLLRVGVPVACQDGFIQVSFLLITAIANSRGVNTAAAVGIVEKIISFLFLVPSAMLSSISAIAAQNAGAGLHRRGRQTLYYGIGAGLVFGLAASFLCQFAAPAVLRIFAGREEAVVLLGSQYLRSYVFDCVFASVHFCYSGYFCAYGKSGYSFIQNVLSVVLIRVPGVYLASKWFPDTLFPMGMAAPLGSLLSALVCVVLDRMLLAKQIPAAEKKRIAIK